MKREHSLNSICSPAKVLQVESSNEESISITQLLTAASQPTQSGSTTTTSQAQITQILEAEDDTVENIEFLEEKKRNLLFGTILK